MGVGFGELLSFVTLPESYSAQGTGCATYKYLMA
jgi:hypothetical protein